METLAAACDMETDLTRSIISPKFSGASGFQSAYMSRTMQLCPFIINPNKTSKCKLPSVIVKLTSSIFEEGNSSYEELRIRSIFDTAYTVSVHHQHVVLCHHQEGEKGRGSLPSPGRVRKDVKTFHKGYDRIKRKEDILLPQDSSFEGLAQKLEVMIEKVGYTPPLGQLIQGTHSIAGRSLSLEHDESRLVTSSRKSSLRKNDLRSSSLSQKNFYPSKLEVVCKVIKVIVGGCRIVQQTRLCPLCAAAVADLCIRTSGFEIAAVEFQSYQIGPQRLQTCLPVGLFVNAGGVELGQELGQVLVQVELPPLLPLPRPVRDGGERCGGCGRSCWRRMLEGYDRIKRKEDILLPQDSSFEGLAQKLEVMIEKVGYTPPLGQLIQGTHSIAGRSLSLEHDESRLWLYFLIPKTLNDEERREDIAIGSYSGKDMKGSDGVRMSRKPLMRKRGEGVITRSYQGREST
ncbi:hypothetical protein M5K25_020907 [Dendrobium thyrsiflorum]|uniref:Uncharacterized protein n=1 Tax=Dendrobium thyrsiflorum TaxID=117978 RepID=A0ABD0UI29_DENTH